MVKPRRNLKEILEHIFLLKLGHTSINFITSVKHSTLLTVIGLNLWVRLSDHVMII